MAANRSRRDFARKSQQKKQGIPGWVWLLSGLFIGLFVAFLVYLQQSGGIKTERISKAPAKSAKQDARSVRKQPQARAPEKKSGIQFDFYSILPEMEVVIPAEELKRPESSGPPAKYFLQVGSFRNAADADTQKAKLALLGLISTIQKVTVDGKATWHRVRLGPYSDRRKLDHATHLLQDNDIDFITLKEKS
jgi:cell division protein FtsN